MVLNGLYQGNKAWAFFVLFVMFILFRTLWGVRKKRNAGLTVDVPGVIGICLVFLGMIAAGIFQIVSHW
jgi:hypothetical protein